MTGAVARALARLSLAGAVLVAPRAALAVVPLVPARWVTDEAGFLSEGARRTLDARLEAYERQTGHQVLVWIGRTTGGLPIEDFALGAFEAWRVGRKGIDDGLVLFVLSEDRQIRIEVGYGLEGQVPDAIASRIIREVMVPRIQAADRDGAVLAGVDALITAIDGRAAAFEPGTGASSPARPPPNQGPRSLTTAEKVLVGLAVIAFLVVLATNPSFALYLLFSILSGGRGGGGSGGAGRYSGGGGRSGGGGASGSW